MSDVVIKVENLGKQYRIGAQQARYPTLRDAIMASFRNLVPRPRSGPDGNGTIWALKDVSFEVRQGEVVGIIGRNGAGKSTLLKILSHITEPTEGRVQLRGRVGSLLEVGTGFHAELTGRENIYLNGAILGMKRAEIERKFDEIVAFAEIERFLDTPVKHYSSGMYVRLAFAVAAHLDPEILLVDEVLAVGDASFQKKCLSKMDDVGREGRTVLFVSHNMQAITLLCKRGMQLSRGELAQDTAAISAVRRYVQSDAINGAEVEWPDPALAPGDDLLRLRAVRLVRADGRPSCSFQSGESIRVQLEFDLSRLHDALTVGFDLGTPEGLTVMRCYHNDSSEGIWPKFVPGRNHIECDLPPGLLNAGTYVISPRVSLHCTSWIVHLDATLVFDVELTHGVSPFWSVLDKANRPGVISPIVPWRVAI